MAEFSLAIDKWVAKAKGNADLVVRKVALDMFTRVILRSPVLTGRFRGNWQVTIGQPATGTVDTEDKSGAATVSKAASGVMQAKAGDVVWLTNNLPYALTLEYGHSKQAPSGMVRITVQEFQSVVDKATKTA
jgi:hypothetical protein